MDTPLTIRASDGRLDTNPQFVTAKTASQVPLEVRAAAGATASWFKVADSAGVAALEVRFDGGVRVNGSEVWKQWTGTQAEYDALGTYDPDTLYVVT